MRIEGIAIATVLALAGCPKGSAPRADMNNCEDVEAHAAKLFSYAEPRRPANVGQGVFAQEAPPPDDGPTGLPSNDEPSDEDREATKAEYGRLEGKAWGADCSANAWSQAQIDCYVASGSVDAGKACVASGEDAPEAEDDPRCAAAADVSAIRIVNDAGAPDDTEMLARARAAIVAPCNAQVFSDDLLECLSDPEVTESFGICGFGMSGQPDWDALVESLHAAGFSSKH